MDVLGQWKRKWRLSYSGVIQGYVGIIGFRVED